MSSSPGGMRQTVGAQIKRLRQARGMSVSELARQAGISKATLSTLEAGQGNPTMDTVTAIAVGLRLPLGDLLLPATPSEPIIRRGTQPPEHTKQELLHRIGTGTLTELWRLRIRTAGDKIESPPHAPGTVEHILVERGPMLIGHATDPSRLDAGDFVIFAADVPHVYHACADDVEAVVIMSYPATTWM